MLEKRWSSQLCLLKALWNFEASKFSQQNARMSEELNSEYSTLGMRDLAIRVLQQGYVCAALSSADETWYRAIIEKVGWH